jgi:GGDEF domain-containing protein
MIEYLALAAEVTAVLLIISVAYPSKGTRNEAGANTAPVSGVNQLQETESFQNSLQTIRLLAFESASKQLASHASIKEWSQSSTRFQIAQSLSELMPLVFEPNPDVTTRLPKMDSLHRFLSATRSLQIPLGMSVEMSMISVDRWSELISKQGAVVSDRLLRELANTLHADLLPHGLVVRFSEYTFAVVLFGVSSEHAFELLEESRLSISSKPIVVGENEVEITLSIAVTKAGELEFDSESKIQDSVLERLEELLAGAITDGGNQTRGDLHMGGKATVDHVEAPQTNNTDVKASESKVEQPLVAPQPNSDEQAGSPDSGEAVKSADDIAALFASQKRNSKPAKVVSVEDSLASGKVISGEKKASSNDIEALFAAGKSKSGNSSEKTEPASNSEIVPANENAKASSDDIAAMFAAQKGKAKTPASLPTQESDAEKSTSDSKEVPAAQESAASLDGKASADDIASLFATTKKPAVSQAPVSQAAEETAPEPTQSGSNSDEATEESLVASIDDINALFAAAQKSKGKKKAESKESLV